MLAVQELIGHIPRLKWPTAVSSSQDVAMRVYCFTQQQKLLISWRTRGAQLIGLAKSKTRCTSNLVLIDAGMQAQDLHPLGRFVKAKNG